MNGGGGAAVGNGGGSDCESDDGEEGDYTVYECPGLAPVSIDYSSSKTQCYITSSCMCYVIISLNLIPDWRDGSSQSVIPRRHNAKGQMNDLRTSTE